MGDLIHEVEGNTLKIPHQIIFVDSLPQGRGPEDLLIIRDMDTIVDSRWPSQKSAEEVMVMLNYLRREIKMIESAREIQRKHREQAINNK
ncbi:MAG: hypothetical protein U5L96_09840 [Owenweeksia sp.]|nr:hypothetical protein [Owenweeksia sp.]